MDKNKRRQCIDCGKLFYVKLLSRRVRCLSCGAKHKKEYDKRWKQNHINRLRVHYKRYNKKRRLQDGPPLGTLQPDDVEIEEGHIKGYTRLTREMRFFE